MMIMPIFPPTKKEIIQRALELFYKDNPHFADLAKPEEYELKERGYLRKAQLQLLREGAKQIELKLGEGDKQYLEYVKFDLDEIDKRLKEMEDETIVIPKEYTPQSLAEKRLLKVLGIESIKRKQF